MGSYRELFYIVWQRSGFHCKECYCEEHYGKNIMMYFLFENEFLWAVFGHCFILSFKLQASIENILLIKAKKSVDVF